MRTRFRSLLALLLLPLLLGILPGWTASGGWFCANGRQCEPVAAVACCCAAATPCVEDRCEEPAAHAVTLSTGSCGCYYHAQILDAGTRSEERFWFVGTALPPARFTLAAPPSRATDPELPSEPLPPPRWRHGTPDLRGPPVA